MSHLVSCLSFCPSRSRLRSLRHFVSPGSGIRKLANELKAGGVIRSSWHFVLMTRLRGDAHRLKAGEYRFSDDMTPDMILKKIVSGEVDYRKFTLPEGYSVYQAAELLEQKGYFRKDAFLEKCRDKALLARFGLNEASAEGYLYPATYNLSRGGSEEQLLEQMIGQSDKSYAATAGGGGHMSIYSARNSHVGVDNRKRGCFSG